MSFYIILSLPPVLDISFLLFILSSVSLFPFLSPLLSHHNNHYHHLSTNFKHTSSPLSSPPSSTFPAIPPDIPGLDTAQRLESVIRAKGMTTEVLQVLSELPNPLLRENEDAEPTHNPLQIQVFVQTILHLGSKSFSHAFAGISKFLKVSECLCFCVYWGFVNELFCSFLCGSVCWRSGVIHLSSLVSL